METTLSGAAVGANLFQTQTDSHPPRVEDIPIKALVDVLTNMMTAMRGQL